jgi:hypothetical protein
MSYSRILQSITPSPSFLFSLTFLLQLEVVNGEDKEHYNPWNLLWIPIGISLAFCAYCLCSGERRENRRPNDPEALEIRAVGNRPASSGESLRFSVAKTQLENLELDASLLEATQPTMPFYGEILSHYQSTMEETEEEITQNHILHPSFQ